MSAAPRLRPESWTLLQELASELGFSALSAAPAAALAELRPRVDAARPADTELGSWLDEGLHGDMAWMADTRELREDPRAWLPEARTVLVGLIPHDSAGEPGDPDDEAGRDVPRARLSRYAWGRDYHLVVGRLLVELGRRLEQEVPGARWAKSVDAGPVMEKPWAQLAGLGWIGKHGNLLRTDGSSWFFIGVLVTDAELDHFEPFTTDHCGTCTACLDACPTDAILAPQRVDARRCISYLTIELRRAVPDDDLREGMGDWVFGCDACQDACPWNRHRHRSGHPRFAPGPLGRGPRIERLLRLDADAFTAATPKSAVKRARREGLVRSAAVAAGNSGDRELAPELGRLLNDEHASVRVHAAWALGRLGGARARTLLEGARTDESAEVRAEVERALART
ncbi:MAG: tRNA epoxyqueuosine(34) reductase QueG [Acidobacteriota bacterium]